MFFSLCYICRPSTQLTSYAVTSSTSNFRTLLLADSNTTYCVNLPRLHDKSVSTWQTLLSSPGGGREYLASPVSDWLTGVVQPPVVTTYSSSGQVSHLHSFQCLRVVAFSSLPVYFGRKYIISLLNFLFLPTYLWIGLKLLKVCLMVLKIYRSLTVAAYVQLTFA